MSTVRYTSYIAAVTRFTGEQQASNAATAPGAVKEHRSMTTQERRAIQEFAGGAT